MTKATNTISAFAATSRFHQQHYLMHESTWPFHKGELQVQQRLGVLEQVHEYAPKFVRTFMPDQHREFYRNQPFLVAAARDTHGHMWSTLLFSSSVLSSTANSFITSPNAKSLILESQPIPGDALAGALGVGTDLGLLGIEFATRRRNRVNGRIVKKDGTELTFHVDQSFGNCPQYIKPREWWTPNETAHNSHENNETPMTLKPFPNSLTPEQVMYVQSAESIFVATGYRDHGGGEDPRFGNDASHRGGSAGFLHVQEDYQTIILPDYNGNNMFNTIGNLVLDSNMGITIPLYETGGLLQLSGQGTILWDDEKVISKYAGAKRLIRFQIERINVLPPGSLPIRWKQEKDNQMTLQIHRKVQESTDVTSIYLRNIQGESPQLPIFSAGQHLQITISMISANGGRTSFDRTYSISSYDTIRKEYRISVKREPHGAVSRHIHDVLQPGHRITAHAPSGDFQYQPKEETTDILFLSAGIGVTPILSMLHAFVQRKDPTKNASWIHSAKDAEHHPFQNEIQDLKVDAGERLQAIVTTYTQESNETLQVCSNATIQKPTTSGMNDKSASFKTHLGRIDKLLLQQYLDRTTASSVQVYMCGPTSFVGSMHTILEAIGIAKDRIDYETF